MRGMAVVRPVLALALLRSVLRGAPAAVALVGNTR